MNTLIKVERQQTSKTWYETMLSPFKTEQEAWSCIEKYRHYYPTEDQNYRMTKPNGELVFVDHTTVISAL